MQNPNAKNQDFMLGKCFKKGLLRTGIKPTSFLHGFVSVWKKIDDKVIFSGYKVYKDDCLVIPMAGPGGFRDMLKYIHRNKPTLNGMSEGNPSSNYEYTDVITGAAAMKPIQNLSAADLIRSLKNLGLVIFQEADEKKWIFNLPDGQFVVLRPEQMGVDGHLNKVPLRVLLVQYTDHIIDPGNTDSLADMIIDDQLISGHHISPAEIEMIYNAAIELKRDLKDVKESGRRKALEDNFSKCIDQFVEAVRAGGHREQPILPVKIIKPFVEDLMMKNNSEIRQHIISINLATEPKYRTAEQRLSDPAMVEKCMSDLVNKHKLTEKQIDYLLRNRRDHLTWPNTYPDTLSAEIISIQAQA